MGLRRTAFFLGLVELLAACSPAALFDLTVPRAGYHVERNLAYGPDARQKLDLYVPDRLAAPAPVLLFFYGGSWKSGSKSLYRAFGQAFASQGMIVAIADYRLYPLVRYPAFLEDGALAFAWLHRHALHWTSSDILAAIPADWSSAARVLLAAWDGAVRVSSAVERWGNCPA